MQFKIDVGRFLRSVCRTLAIGSAGQQLWIGHLRSMPEGVDNSQQLLACNLWRRHEELLLSSRCNSLAQPLPLSRPVLLLMVVLCGAWREQYTTSPRLRLMTKVNLPSTTSESLPLVEPPRTKFRMVLQFVVRDVEAGVLLLGQHLAVAVLANQFAQGQAAQAQAAQLAVMLLCHAAVAGPMLPPGTFITLQRLLPMSDQIVANNTAKHD
uniref:Secreted protein n=1 Tax=Macrostomum lignano TaxID=282301 RepID=A0A1I8IF38_9PLAT